MAKDKGIVGSTGPIAISPKFSFSPTFKQGSTVLSENNTRVTGKGIHTSAIVEPRLPMNSKSKISFKVNKNGWLYVGVCYPAVLDQPNYVYSSN